MPGPVTRQAYAKVNLALSVGPPVPAEQPGAGLHPLASWTAPIDLRDELTVTPGRAGSGIELDRSWADDAPAPRAMRWADDDDLVVRAVRRLGARAGHTLHGRIRLVKRIPTGGGLGGGSADAAACLLAANRAFGLGLAIDELAEVGAELGADVPYFLDPAVAERDGPPRAAMVTGFGERVERLPIRPASLLLVLPAFGCPTAEVYDAFDHAPVTLDEPGVLAMAAAGDIPSAALFNDLEKPARRYEPRLAEQMEEAARVTGLPVHLSGSGSAFFLVTDEPGRWAAALRVRLPGSACIAASVPGAEGAAR